MRTILERARDVRNRSRSVLRLNIELAQLELKRKARLYGITVGLAIVALALVLYAIGFLFAATAAAIAEVLPLWAALLIVAGLLLLTASGLAYAASRAARKAGPPQPVQAVEEAQETAREIRDA